MTPVPTASTIKLPIMVELFAEAEEGKLDWNQKLEAHRSGQGLRQRGV